MKGYQPALVFGGLIATIILQGILFASTGLQTNRLQKQLDEISQKFDQLQDYVDATQKMITKINSFIDEPLPEDTAIDEISDSNDLLSPENLDKTLGI